ncbi:MAG: family 43 glycosylhydrolase [Prevotella sp.]|nr:family 43 glycosylhydrolase [Prevotella sp.]
MRQTISSILAVIAVTAAGQTVKNTDKPMVHDPVIAMQDGTFYMMSTGHGLQLATSEDMNTWTVWSHTPVLSHIPEWTHDSVPGFKSHVWAPDIIRFRNRWWLAYSCSTFGKNTSAIGLASTDKLTVPDKNGGKGTQWRDEGTLVCSKGGRDNWNAIDPNFIIDENGNPWLTFGSFWDGIQLAPLDSTMHIACRDSIRTIARRKTTGRANPIEAPFIFRHGDYYYLFVSWDYCCRGMESTYKVAVGRSRTVTGPYIDRDGRDMRDGGGTVFFEGDKRQFEAAGHSAAYNFGDQDIFICHGYSIADNGASILVRRNMEWTADGWPQLKAR